MDCYQIIRQLLSANSKIQELFSSLKFLFGSFFKAGPNCILTLKQVFIYTFKNHHSMRVVSCGENNITTGDNNVQDKKCLQVT